MNTERRVMLRIAERREQGIKKYGQTMERDDLTRLEWLRHAQDEALDLAIYLEKLIEQEIEKFTQDGEKPDPPTYKEVLDAAIRRQEQE